jgi:hypothetical protein
MNKHIGWGFVLMTLLVASWEARAQRATGTISGQVVSTDGQPLHRAKIQLIAIGDVKKTLASRRELSTDEAGRFVAEKLEPAAYTVSASAPGYVLLPHEKVSAQMGGGEQFVHLGETLTIRMQRGGVITGRVLNAAGAPVVGLTLEATRLRDEKGRPAPTTLETNAFGMGRQTDDRGVYRLYGLAPGTYIVSAGGGTFGMNLKPSPFAGRTRIYHPANPRDTATEIVVESGAEVSGIDIRYRAERGVALTGKVLGAPSGGGMTAMTATMVALTAAGSDTMIATTMVLPMNDNGGYSFFGLPEGDYDVTVMRPDVNAGKVMMSLPRRVRLKGTDVTGVDLRLVALASISGSVSLEKVPPPQCKAKRDSFLDEIVLATASAEPEAKPMNLQSLWGAAFSAPVSEQGAFTIYGLSAGQHFLTAQLPDEYWYVKAITLPATAAGTAVARDAGRSVLNLKAGEKLTDVRVTIAEGAASLQGKVTTNGKSPSPWRIHLLPAEPEAKEDLLRYAETPAEENGSFAFAHLAPGNYWLVVRAVPDAAAAEKVSKPVAWNAAERAKLRREAEAAKIVVTLKPCQQVSDFALRWGQ